jgi:hypothetical protein
LQITCQEKGKHDAAAETHGCWERKKRKKVSATTAVKDTRAGKPVKTREAAATPAAEKGGQPTFLDVDVDVDTVAKNKTHVGRGKRKTPPESSVEPVKMPKTVAVTVGMDNIKTCWCCQEEEEGINKECCCNIPETIR